MGGAAIEWLAKSLYGGEPDLQKLETEASSTAPGAEGLLFLPYLSGERAPHWDEMARGAFVGLTERHTRAHCARSVYEGVAFAVWDLLERGVTASRLHPPSLRVSGGGARSMFWNQIKADITGLPVQQMSISDAACLGAAMLAAIGSGAFASLGDAAEAMTHPGTLFPPRLEYAARYETLRSLWRGLYPALRGTFSMISQMEGTPSP